MEHEHGASPAEYDEVAQPAHDPYAPFAGRDFRLWMIGNIAATVGLQMQSVAVGWEVFDRTRSSLALGWVGLIQVLPLLVLGLAAGHTIDRSSRRGILMAAMAMIGVASILLAWISFVRAPLWMMYASLFLSGVARAFQLPAKTAFFPQVVPWEQFPTAVTWSSGAFQLASVVGPFLGGVLIAADGSARYVYVASAASEFTFVALLALIRGRPRAPAAATAGLADFLSGLRFLKRSPVILGAITLDMVAVLLGGATAMMPVYAEEILEVGPRGLGALRLAPSLGALAMAFFLAHAPPMRRAGRALLWSVAGFGAATIVFGWSRTFWLSWAMLMLTGAFDNVSVVVRQTLIQILTPDAMRGRVSAVNSMFIGASNELGQFESGLVAWLTNPTFSVVSGGVGTLVVVAGTAVVWPEVRRYGALVAPVEEEVANPSRAM